MILDITRFFWIARGTLKFNLQQDFVVTKKYAHFTQFWI